MARYIDADVLRQGLIDSCDTGADKESMSVSLLLDILDDFPTADVKEVVRGQWERVPLNVSNDRYGMNKYNFRIRCTGCGFVTTSDFAAFQFCHCCGADMRGANNE